MRRAKVAEAPVTTEELQELSDLLDFLSKYCIIFIIAVSPTI